MTISARVRLERPGFRLEVDLTLPGQGVTVILGASGSGKTTLLRILAGLEPAASGEVQVNGTTWQGPKHFLPAHRRAAGLVFQHPELFPHLTVRKNIEFGLRRTAPGARRVTVAELLARLGLADLGARRPGELSGGETQRVAMARALAASPEVLLLDEPFASLDPARRSELVPWLDALQRSLDIPVVHVTHSVEEALRLGDQLVVLENGRVLAQGSPAELLSQPGGLLGMEPDPPSLLEGTVRALDPTFGLGTVAFTGGEATVPMRDVVIGTALRLLIRASDVSLALDPPSRSSVLNVFRGRVLEIVDQQEAQVLVRVELGGSILMARITRRSAAHLALAPGVTVFAQVKSVAILD